MHPFKEGRCAGPRLARLGNYTRRVRGRGPVRGHGRDRAGEMGPRGDRCAPGCRRSARPTGSRSDALPPHAASASGELHLAVGQRHCGKLDAHVLKLGNKLLDIKIYHFETTSMQTTIPPYYERGILCSRHDPKIAGSDDAEVVGDRITHCRPIPRNVLTQEAERRIGELGDGCVAFVVGDVSVHDAP